MGYRDDFGIAAARVVSEAALRLFAGCNDGLIVELKRRKSEASPFSEFLWLAAGFRDGGGGVIASSPLPREKTRKVVELVEQLGAQGTASLAALQKLAASYSSPEQP